MQFQLTAPFTPAGDQPNAIAALTDGLAKGHEFQTLLGVTGSGKTFSMASVIQNVQRPTLIISPNKTLAAQTYQEFREFFPNNAVHYFVSYYDYYQPEAYIPHTDTYIEKEAQVNETIDRLRHAATQALLTRRDVIVVASVSCIYGLGSPEAYAASTETFRVGQRIDRQKLLRKLAALQYERNDIDFHRGTYRVRGATIEIHPVASDKTVVRLQLNTDQIARISFRDTAGAKGDTDQIELFPATHYVAAQGGMKAFASAVEAELEERLVVLRDLGKTTELERLARRVRYDLEMIRNVGYCNGIENYSRYLDGRKAGEPAFTLLDYFTYDQEIKRSKERAGKKPAARSQQPSSWLLFIDESHITVPQIRGMYFGDRARKDVLVDFGFRLPSARDNRPLQFAEFEQRMPQTIFVSATPGPYDLAHSRSHVIEQIIRPTGLIDPVIEVRGSEGQVPHLIGEIEARVAKKQRVLVTTLTKRMSEELTEYLRERGIRVQYLHSDIETLERLEILNDLRRGQYDVLVGINLLREGLDLPEVSLVAILDADSEGFLRNATTLIQTMGRAARHSEGRVLLYADRMTDSMKKAISETERRRKMQLAYNKKNRITPISIQKRMLAPIADPADARVSDTEKKKRRRRS